MNLAFKVVCVDSEWLTEPYMKIYTGQTCRISASYAGAGLEYEKVNGF